MLIQKLKDLVLRKRLPALSKPVLINSLPKAGTHMLSNMLESLDGSRIALDLTSADKYIDSAERLNYLKNSDLNKYQAGDIIVAHIPYSPEIENYLNLLNIHHIFLFRDPRDVLSSLYRYVLKNENHFYHSLLANRPKPEGLKMLVLGHGLGKDQYLLNSESIASMKHFIGAYVGWLKNDDNYYRYEMLVSEKHKEESINQLVKNLNLTKSDKNRMISALNAKNASTFDKGIVGGWLTEIPTEIINLLEVELSEVNPIIYWNE